MTPAINSAKNAKISYTVHRYEHDPKSASYGEEAAEKLSVAAERVFKTLVVESDDNTLVVAVLPVSTQLDLKLLASLLKKKKMKMADPKIVERSTGYVLGGVSPLGQKKRLRTVVDKSAMDFETVFVSAGQRGVEIELAAGDLITMVNGICSRIKKAGRSV